MRTTLRDLRSARASPWCSSSSPCCPGARVRDNVGLGLELRGIGKAERDRIVDEKLAMVGLTRWAGKYAHELSGGMQQRVGLARAFATDADILLMDEPFSALDPLIRTKLQDELLELQAKLKKTILFVSHDLDEAIKLGNRIVIMEGGRIVQAGTAEDIVLRPADSYVAEFVRHMNPLEALRVSTVMTPLAALAARGRRRHGLRGVAAPRCRSMPRTIASARPTRGAARAARRHRRRSIDLNGSGARGRRHHASRRTCRSRRPSPSGTRRTARSSWSAHDGALLGSVNEADIFRALLRV